MFTHWSSLCFCLCPKRPHGETKSISQGISQGHGFREAWLTGFGSTSAPKNWCFWTVVLEKTPDNPFNCKEIQPVHPKGNQSWVFIGRTDAEAGTPVLWPLDAKSWLIGKDPDAGKDWGQEEKGTTEDEMVGWHYWLNRHEFGWTLGVGDGQGGLACCDSWGCKESDTTEKPNWTQLNSDLPVFIKSPKRYVLLIYPFFKWGNWSQHVLYTPYPAGSKAKVWTQSSSRDWGETRQWVQGVMGLEHSPGQCDCDGGLGCNDQRTCRWDTWEIGENKTLAKKWSQGYRLGEEQISNQTVEAGDGINGSQHQGRWRE